MPGGLSPSPHRAYCSAVSTPRRRLDTIGKVCPLPILMTAKEMLNLRSGEELEVVGDDPAILDDMPVYCFRAGHELLSVEEDPEGQIFCHLRKR